MVRLFGFGWGGGSGQNSDRAVDEVDRASSGTKGSVSRNSPPEKDPPISGNAKKGKKKRRRFEEERKKEEQKGARRKNSAFEHRGSLTSSAPQGRQPPVRHNCTQ